MPHTILLADTAPDRRIGLCAELRRGRYDVISVCNRADLVERAAAHRPTLAICDTSLDGVATPDQSAISAVKALPGCTSTPLLALVPPHSAGARLAALQAGADAALPRTSSKELLLARIRSLLRTSDTTAALNRRTITVQDLGFAEPGAEFVQPSRVALVSHDIARARIWASDLARLGDTTFSTHTLDSALGGLDTSAPPDIAVIEAPLIHPGAALGLLAELRSRPGTRHAGIVIVHDGDDAQTATMALDLGANDLVELGFPREELVLRTDALVRAKRHDDRLRANLDEGLRLAVEDPLTGLFNRRYALAHARRQAENGAGYCVVMADLDRFKSINDSFGHAAGDQVLISVAKCLRDNVRSIDMVARIGGEEFLIFLPDPDLVAAESAARRLCEVIHETPVSLGPGHAPIHVTASFGVAQAGRNESLEEAIARADHALFGAKKAGRDTVLLAPPCAA